MPCGLGRDGLLRSDCLGNRRGNRGDHRMDHRAERAAVLTVCLAEPAVSEIGVYAPTLVLRQAFCRGRGRNLAGGGLAEARWGCSG